MPFQSLGLTMLIAFDFEYFDSLVGRAGGQSSAIVIQNGVVLRNLVKLIGSMMRSTLASVQSYHHDQSWR